MITIIIYYNYDYDYHLDDTYQWEKVEAVGDIPSSRGYHSVVFLPDENRVLLFGGFDGGTYFNDMFSFDLEVIDLSIPYRTTTIEFTVVYSILRTLST